MRSVAGRVTVRKIAEYAGVSIGSVSSVLNNRHVERRISLETVEKVRAAAKKLGYLPNINARSLRRGGSAGSSIVLAMITSFEAPIPVIEHFIVALRQAMAARSEYTFSVVIEMFAVGHLREVPGLLTGDHFNAALILNTSPQDDQFLMRNHLPYPVVLVNRLIDGYSSVIEQADAGAHAAKILFRSHRRLPVVLHGELLTQSTQARVDSFLRRMLQLLGQPAKEIVAGSLSEEAGYRAMGTFLKRGGKCDGLYTVSDSLALGAYRAIKEAGLRIAKDIVVIGVGDYEIAPFFDPPLSCVGVSHKELAREASQLLLRQFERPAPAPAVMQIPIVEILRASCGRA